MCNHSEICENILESVKCICYSLLCTFFLYGLYLLIESPSKDERMADKGYVYVHPRTINSGTYLPVNSTEFSDSVKEMYK